MWDMWFFTEEERLLQSSVHDFTQNVIAPKAEHADESENIPLSHFHDLAKLGLLGITAPEEYGGAGLGCVAATLAIEEVGKACASTALSYLAHSILVVHNLGVNGSSQQKEKYLPDMISGKTIAGLGITEPESGSDALSMTSRAEKKGANYALTGSKMFITNGPIGDVFYCYARTGKGKKDLSTFIVEKDFPGFRRGKTLHKMGMRGSPTGELIFENCIVPEANRVGEEGDSSKHMLKNLDIERITISGISLGIAHSSIEVASKYARERKQFDTPIAKFQMIQQMIADADTELAAARALVYEAAKRYDLARAEGRPPGKTEALWAARAKLFSATRATQIALNAIQILGGYGYIREFPVERYMRDAKLMEIGAGTNEIMRLIIARDRLALNDL